MKRFNSLELVYKSSLLKKYAHDLAETHYQHYTVKLYYWDRFLIERYYDNDRKQTTAITIANTTDLDKFMRDISIDDLGLPVHQ